MRFLHMAAAVFALATGLLAPAAIAADLPGAADRQDAPAAEAYFGNVALISHDGQTLHLYQDLIKNKTVIFSAFFSRCQGVCPPLNAKLLEMQRALGPRVGKDVLFVSITVDPEFDTPVRLKEMAKLLHAGPGWLFMSGTSENVRAALQKLGYATPEKEAHSPILVIGKEKTGMWKKAHGFAPTEEILTIVRSVIDDQG